MENDYMSKQARDELNRYHREWRKNNPDKVKERNKRYWERRAAMREVAEREGVNG